MDSLTSFLDLVCTPTRKQIMLDTFNRLWDLGIRQHSEDIDLILHDSEDDRENESVMLEIDRTLYNHCVNTLNEFGVKVFGGEPLQTMSSFLEMLISIEAYGAPDELWAITQEEISDIHKLGDLVEHLTDLPSNNIIELIDEVDETLMVRIQKQLEKNQPEETIEWTQKKETILRYKQKYPFDFDKTLFKKGFVLGTPLGPLLNTIEDDLMELGSAFPFTPDKLCNELVGVILMSNGPEDKVLLTASDIVQDLIEDPFNVSKVVTYLTNMEF